ncbi:hypothetical protein H6G89_05425 [Oscillatoria sp. FACHB-1407]|uniref:DUF5331 domain-containing protein n=1 Tax=Oscillatoria sp. FACHB-1407 TaxID=2692847 RepID=UPI0016850F6A|nr:DUF5331 domain-containing protein [Oscillatoria sp. FACHB-1407]MBD2460480.1 hypothetical protein [Oscillatoria sp. FACHB-1407]
MNIEHLRRSLKASWLNYYRENRSWLVRLGVWVNCDGQRRPSSSFILATLSTLEPQLTQLLPLIVDLSSNPDRIVVALGLNFSPDEELETLGEVEGNNVRLLPGGERAFRDSRNGTLIEEKKPSASRLPVAIDESCQGVRNEEGVRIRDT